MTFQGHGSGVGQEPEARAVEGGRASCTPAGGSCSHKASDQVILGPHGDARASAFGSLSLKVLLLEARRLSGDGQFTVCGLEPARRSCVPAGPWRC